MVHGKSCACGQEAKHLYEEWAKHQEDPSYRMEWPVWYTCFHCHEGVKMVNLSQHLLRVVPLSLCDSLGVVEAAKPLYIADRNARKRTGLPISYLELACVRDTNITVLQ